MPMLLMLTTESSLVQTVQRFKWWLSSRFVKKWGLDRNCQTTYQASFRCWKSGAISRRTNGVKYRYGVTTITRKSCHQVAIRNIIQLLLMLLKSTSLLRMTSHYEEMKIFKRNQENSWKTIALQFQQLACVFQFSHHSESVYTETKEVAPPNMKSCDCCFPGQPSLKTMWLIKSILKQSMLNWRGYICWRIL